MNPDVFADISYELHRLVPWDFSGTGFLRFDPFFSAKAAEEKRGVPSEWSVHVADGVATLNCGRLTAGISAGTQRGG
ncbi:MAG: hypothetical protein NTV94_04875 [Planctomycetota bacterium]|nr:hypothetical protein [Planctomycetota bacterium]